ncbi:MAG: aminotransferase class I/II-fold pyridoxal phosphate-dependent enzyme [Tannerellaceae bacterium]|jgi:8-amino-7-oxononanoate synthase|nr:aminotransferase class I/II-fold pyridoxal phosphate-dependent enzyme [Tannerellaceae bacterium]
MYKVDLQTNRENASKENCSILDKVNDYTESVKTHEELGLNLLRKSASITASNREVTVFERHSQKEIKTLMFGSNNYIGAITNEYVIKKTIEATEKSGIGSGGVPILSGTTYYHDKLEKKLSKFGGFEDTILFTSGFTANLRVILGLIRPNNLILQDRLNHASLMDGGMLSGARMLRYKHNDPTSLEKLLKENYEQYKGGILVITDGVFSMNGDIARIPEILDLVKKYDALLLIDEAHATGVIGNKGAGTLDYHNIKDRSNIILSGTLSKTLGSVGGYISASQNIIDYLRFFASSNLYSTSLPPSICASAMACLEYMQNSDVVERLNANARYLREKLRSNGFNILDTITPIIPVIVGDEYKMCIMSKFLLDNGIYTSYIQPPAVPLKTCRIRINVMVSHTQEDMDHLVEKQIESCMIN